MRFAILERPREIKRVDFLIGVERDIEIGSSYRIYECLVFILWVEDYDIYSHHECPKDLEFHGE
jgi:hypothetical protein